MTGLAAVIADYGAGLVNAARAVGGRIEFDPARMLIRDAALGLQPPGLWSPNRHCRLVQAADGWIAVNLARDDDAWSVPAWLGTSVDAEVWYAVTAGARKMEIATLIERAILLQLPIAVVGEAGAARRQIALMGPAGFNLASKVSAGSLRVVDLSALWAGPLCGALLAEAGAQVTRFDSTLRPDPTAYTAPELDARLNGRKTRVAFDFADSARLVAAVVAADIVITAARPHALARLGLVPDVLFAANPGLIWVAITAHGWRGAGAMRVGFGDDCAAAGGLVGWTEGMPHFLGDALADPLTGIAAATAAMEAVAAGRAGLIDCALAGVAADAAARIAG